MTQQFFFVAGFVTNMQNKILGGEKKVQSKLLAFRWFFFHWLGYFHTEIPCFVWVFLIKKITFKAAFPLTPRCL